MSNIITMDDDGSALRAPPDLSDFDQQVRILLFHSWTGHLAWTVGQARLVH